MHSREDGWIPKLSDQPDKIETHSWFQINKYVKENNDKKGNTSACIIISPDANQESILLKWLDLSRQMYNITTAFIKKKIFIDGQLNIDRVNKYINPHDLSSTYLKSEKEKLQVDQIDPSILDESIKRCVARYVSDIQKYLSNDNQGKIRVRPIKEDKRYKTFVLRKKLFSDLKPGFCVDILGYMDADKSFIRDAVSTNENTINVYKSCVVSYDQKMSKFSLFVPTKEHIVTESVCGIDPGVRTFLTVYSDTECLEIGSNNGLKKYYDKIEKVNRQFNTDQLRNTTKYKKIMKKINRKIDNKVTDMHLKAGKFLCTKYDTIKLGNMSTNSESNLMLSHDRFRQRLAYQAKKYNVKLEIVPEYMTTKTCSNCSNKQNVGNSKIFHCNKCGMETGRDINAAKNIRYRKNQNYRKYRNYNY